MTRGKKPPEARKGDESSKDMLIRRLEEQLRMTREQLQGTTEQLETSNEELMSINEELISVNEELVVKIDELNQANSDMENLLASSGIATIFLDRQLNIKGFTPAVAAIFNLISADIGRPFRHFTGKIDWPTLAGDAETVLAGQPFSEREVTTTDMARRYLKRIFPYRVQERGIDGIVITFIDITEHKRMEEQTVHLASFPRLNPNPVLEVDSSGRVVFSNPATRKFLESAGMDTADVEVFLPADLDCILRDWDRESAATLYREITVGEKVFGESIFLTPQFCCARIYAYDITERKQAQDALAESEERFRTLADSMPNLAWWANRDGYITWYNQRWYEYTGTTPEQMEGWGWQNVHDPEVLPHVLEQWRASIATGQPFDMEFPLRGADGIFRTFLTRVLPMKDTAGRVQQWFGTNTDVSELKRVEQALRASEALYRSIGESIDYGVWVCAPDGRNTYASESFLKMAGITQEQCSNFGWGDVLHPDDAERNIAAWQECVRTGGKWDVEHRFRGADGQWHHVLARGVPVRDEQGKTFCWAGINLDIDRLKQTEEQLRIAKDEAEAASRAKSQFLANMSHELRTPMAGVLGMLDLVLGSTLDEKQKEYLCIAHTSAHSLLRIINDILDLTKMEAGKLIIQDDPFAFREWLASTVDIFMPEARCKGLDLACSATEELPQIAVGDQLRLRQVLTNLIGNAVKFTEHGKVEVKVAAGGKKADGRQEFIFTIADTGIGIPGDKGHLLFRSFSQADDSHSRTYGGTGLGLAISKELVELMGGRIGFESTENAGSLFSFTVPLGDAGTGGATASLPAAQAQKGVMAPRLEANGKRRILIAEDDPVNRKILDQVFRLRNFEPAFAANGLEAVEMWEKGAYGLIIMDVQMPRMDGFAATRAIREQERSLDCQPIIIAMTAHAFREDEQRCLEAGMDGYISKPVDFNKCFELIENLVKEKASPI